MSLTRERIQTLAPDQASLAAALKLVKPASWPVLAATADAGVLWGECQGSGSSPYRVVVSPADTGYKCTCPSRKFPCKHVLAVLWLRVDKPERFETAAAPQWVADWSARRRPAARPRPAPGAAADGAGPPPSVDAALAAEAAAAPADPKAAARAEAQRRRLREEREAAVLAGLDDLDRWVLDQLSQGLAGFSGRCAAAVRTLSTRLVDAKAGGLAARLDSLAAELFRVPEAERADLAVERLAAVTLIASAYRRQDRLPPPLREDVRRAAGWPRRREELLADATAPRVTATWIVAANRSEVQPDKLLRLETWLVRAGHDRGHDRDPGPAGGGAPGVAVLMDFVPAAGGSRPGFAFEAGEHLCGEVVFYPSAAPLRGLFAAPRPAPAAPWPRSSRGIAPALADYERRLGALPWLEHWPLMMDGVALRPAGTGSLAIADGDGRAIAVTRGQTQALVPMLGLEEISLVCLWDGRTAEVIAADTAIGRWHGG